MTFATLAIGKKNAATEKKKLKRVESRDIRRGRESLFKWFGT